MFTVSTPVRNLLVSSRSSVSLTITWDRPDRSDWPMGYNVTLQGFDILRRASLFYEEGCLDCFINRTVEFTELAAGTVYNVSVLSVYPPQKPNTAIAEHAFYTGTYTNISVLYVVFLFKINQFLSTFY